MSPSADSATVDGGGWLFDRALRFGMGRLAPGGDRGRLSIVIFHRVHAEPDPLFPGEPDRQRFELICRWLKSWFNVLALDDAVERLKHGRLPERALAITFDDGYADNHDHALPVLRALDLPAAVFVATGYMDGGCMWNDVVVEAFRRTRREHLDLAGIGVPALNRVVITDLASRRAAIQMVLGAVKYLTVSARDEAVHALARAAQVDIPRDLMLSTNQLRALGEKGVLVGAHTVTHPILACVDAAVAEEEITRNRDHLQSLLQRRVGLFAYPNGRPGRDYLPAHVELIRSLGFDAAVSTQPGSNGADAALFELRRFTPWDRSRHRFGVRMALNLRAG